jgi:hypothetical protein
MKHLITALLLLLVSQAKAQIPQAFNYQAAIRDADGNPLVNEEVIMLFNFRQEILDGNLLYQETHTVQTNDFGLVNLNLGSGSPIFGSFADIDWSCCIHFLESKVDIGNGQGFLNLGTQQFLSVPYALASEKTKNTWTTNGNTGIDQNNDFIGTTDSRKLRFRTNNVERMVVNTNGYVSMGISTAASRLHLHNDGSVEPISNVIQFTDGASGLGYYDGFVVGILEDNSYGISTWNDNMPLKINTNGAQIDIRNGIINLNSSRVGIGTGSPEEKVHIRDNDFQFRISNNDNTNFWNFGASSDNWAAGADKLIIHNQSTSSNAHFTIVGSNGYVGINDTSPSYHLEVNGTAAKPGGGTWTASSDARLKEVVSEYQDGLASVLEINPVRYHYLEKTGHDTSKEHIGVIAQELQVIAPYMVGEQELELSNGEKGTFLDVDNSAMIYMLINAVQEQQDLIKKLQEENGSIA